MRTFAYGGVQNMKVAVLGGGPAGLYFAISMKLRDPGNDVTVIERNRADDTFGWGVVLSDETLDNLAQNDAKSAAAIREHFAYWDDIAVFHKGTRTLSTGHGFCGIGRKMLLQLLQASGRLSWASMCNSRLRRVRSPTTCATMIWWSPPTG
jgi:anthraniloyl-CoA monooxygenase